MVEVFKTNVNEHTDAEKLLNCLHAKFACYQANFDLNDCDRILRVASKNQFIDAIEIIKLLNKTGFKAEILKDEIPVF